MCVRGDMLEGGSGEGEGVEGAGARWMLKPILISNDLWRREPSQELEQVGLDEDLMLGLARSGVDYLFPVQAAVLEHVLRLNKCWGSLPRRDLAVCAPTGSGKTLAYALPLLQLLRPLRPFSKLFALVLVPVQDLALQAASVLKALAAPLRLRVLYLASSSKLSKEEERARLVGRGPSGEPQSGPHVLVTTPGKLVEHLDHLDLSQLRFLVVDEADRLLRRVQHGWAGLVEAALARAGRGTPPAAPHSLASARYRPQKLLFSATLSQDPDLLAALHLFQPVLITGAAPGSTPVSLPPALQQLYCQVESGLKPVALSLLVAEERSGVVVFVKSNEDAHRLTQVLASLQPGLVVRELSATKSLHQRHATLSELSAGSVHVLITANRLARGVDIPGVRCVISYDAPKSPEEYVHRAGRTCRGTRSGKVITLLAPHQLHMFLAVVRRVAADLSPLTQLTLADSALRAQLKAYRKALNKLKLSTCKEQKQALLQAKARKLWFRRNTAKRPPPQPPSPHQ